MATSPLRLQQGYGIGNALQPLPPFSIIANRAPTQQDKARIGTFWVYTALNNVYVLTSVTGGNSNWLTLSNGGAGVFLSLTVNGPSTFAGNITQTAGVTTLLATTVSSLICNGNLTTNIGAVTINAPAVPATSSLTVFGQNTAAQASLVIEATVNGVHNAIQAYNLDNVNAASCEIAVITASQDGAAGRNGDSQVRFTTTAPTAPGTVEFTIGKDASANDFVISQGPSLGTNDRLTIDGATGAVSLPSQPAFRAVRTADTGAETGNNTPYDVIFQSTQYNIGACYTAGTGVFQAPIAGRYLLSANIIVDNIAAGMTSASIGFWDGGQFVGTLTYMNPVPVLIGGGTFFSFPINTIISLAALANINVRVNLAGGALAATIPANTTCFFAAELLG